MKTLLAIIAGVWVIGRLSRLSPNHPVNSIPPIIATLQVSSQPAPVNGTWQETAQIQGSLVAGDGGGE